MISIIIPTYNKLDLLRSCLESIFKFTNFSNKELEIIVVSNGCKDGTVEYCKSLDQEIVKVLEYPEAMGYTKAVNAGIQASLGKYILLLNNDTQILWQAPKDWIDLLLEPFLTYKDIGIVGIHHLNQYNISFLVFYCVLIKKELFDKIGLLDEKFSPGFCDDIDFCQRTAEAGYKLLNINPENNYPFYHLAEGTFNDEEWKEKYQEVIIKNVKYLKEKYFYLN